MDMSVLSVILCSGFVLLIAGGIEFIIFIASVSLYALGGAGSTVDLLSIVLIVSIAVLGLATAGNNIERVIMGSRNCILGEVTGIVGLLILMDNITLSRLLKFFPIETFAGSADTFKGIITGLILFLFVVLGLGSIGVVTTGVMLNKSRINTRCLESIYTSSRMLIMLVLISLMVGWFYMYNWWLDSI